MRIWAALLLLVALSSPVSAQFDSDVRVYRPLRPGERMLAFKSKLVPASKYDEPWCGRWTDDCAECSRDDAGKVTCQTLDTANACLPKANRCLERSKDYVRTCIYFNNGCFTGDFAENTALLCSRDRPSRFECKILRSNDYGNRVDEYRLIPMNEVDAHGVWRISDRAGRSCLITLYTYGRELEKKCLFLFPALGQFSSYEFEDTRIQFKRRDSTLNSMIVGLPRPAAFRRRTLDLYVGEGGFTGLTLRRLDPFPNLNRFDGLWQVYLGGKRVACQLSLLQNNERKGDFVLTEPNGVSTSACSERTFAGEKPHPSKAPSNPAAPEGSVLTLPVWKSWDTRDDGIVLQDEDGRILTLRVVDNHLAGTLHRIGPHPVKVELRRQ